MQTITTAQLRAKLDAGPVALFDVRGDVVYEQGHIPGAKTAPLGSLTFRVARIMNPGSFVVVYAEGAGSNLAEQAVERLEDLGMTNVHCYAEGLDGWQAVGLSIVESPSPKTHTHGSVREVRPLIVDRERAYGGAFSHKPMEGGAGG